MTEKKFDGFYYLKWLADQVAAECNGIVHREGNRKTGFRYYVMREELWPGEMDDITNYPGMPFGDGSQGKDGQAANRGAPRRLNKSGIERIR